MMTVQQERVTRIVLDCVLAAMLAGVIVFLCCGCLAPTVRQVSPESEAIIRANFAYYDAVLAAHAESRARQRFNRSACWRYTPAMYDKNWAHVRDNRGWVETAYRDLLREEGIPNEEEK